jgi:hypothetical protein
MLPMTLCQSGRITLRFTDHPRGGARPFIWRDKTEEGLLDRAKSITAKTERDSAMDSVLAGRQAVDRCFPRIARRVLWIFSSATCEWAGVCNKSRQIHGGPSGRAKSGEIKGTLSASDGKTVRKKQDTASNRPNHRLWLMRRISHIVHEAILPGKARQFEKK